MVMAFPGVSFEGVEVVVLDACPQRELGRATRDLLGESLPSSCRVRYVEVGDPAEGAGIIPEQWSPDLLCLAVDASGASALADRGAPVLEGRPRAPLLMVAESDCSEHTLALLRAGVDDFLLAPLRRSELLPRVKRLGLGRRCPPREVGDPLGAALAAQNLIGGSPAFSAVVERIPLVTRCDIGVLVTGETGTGKELIARAIHYLGDRADRPFVPVNCGALPTDLIESELFGHGSSAYTGARVARSGLIEEAAGGTLFLDEVDCLPLGAQSKLLRFLQQGEFRRLGDTQLRQSNARIISAANGDLEAKVRAGEFRMDLYYRLNVVPIRMPPLRERREDIPLLAAHFIERHRPRLGGGGRRLSSAALERLIMHDYPGNVRELEHLIQRAIILAGPSPVIASHHIDLPAGHGGGEGEGFKEAKARAVNQFERSYLARLLTEHRGNVSRAAAAARKDRRALWELIRKHGLDLAPFRKLTSRKG